jgi:prefoldin subunit 5
VIVHDTSGFSVDMNYSDSFESLNSRLELYEKATSGVSTSIAAATSAQHEQSFLNLLVSFDPQSLAEHA